MVKCTARGLSNAGVSKIRLPTASLIVSRGFNSNIRLGDTVYHVQTEDRGSSHPFIDTIVYAEGRVLHRRSTSYLGMLGSASMNQVELLQRVEQQHRRVIEELRLGMLKLDSAAGAPVGIEIRLLNPNAWFSSGMVTLQIEVRERGTCQPGEGVSVEVALEGTVEPMRFAARTNSEGYAELSFPLPEIVPDGATLVIRAAGHSGEDEIRYNVRPKPRADAPQTSAQ